MPSYDFLNQKTEEVECHVMKMSEYDDFVKDNPHLKRQYTAPPLVSSKGGNVVSQTSGDFRDLLKGIKNRSAKSNTIKTY
jgi:hypothetical protein